MTDFSLPKPLAAMLVIVMLSGCRSEPERDPVYPVTGIVLFQGKPAEGAVVWLHSIEEEASKEKFAVRPRSVGFVQSDGSFEVTTYTTNDGAPVGRYRIGITWMKKEGGDGSETSLLPARYMDPKLSGLPLIQVKEEPNLLPTFQLAP